MWSRLHDATQPHDSLTNDGHSNGDGGGNDDNSRSNHDGGNVTNDLELQPLDAKRNEHAHNPMNNNNNNSGGGDDVSVVIPLSSHHSNVSSSGNADDDHIRLLPSSRGGIANMRVVSPVTGIPFFHDQAHGAMFDGTDNLIVVR